MSKFKVGDRVICVKDNPVRPEGWIGIVSNPDLGVDRTFDWYVVGEEDHQEHAFNEDELELLKRDVITPNDFKGIKDISALDKQVSGNHYKDCGIQPIEYIHANGLNYFEGNAVKYITRHRKKNGKADIEKAIHYLELMIELEYPE